MGQDKGNVINIEKLIDKAVKKAFDAGMAAGIDKVRSEVKDSYKSTEQRLYAYAALKDNIVGYHKDIEDLGREGVTGRSKDLVFFSARGGTRLSADEIFEAKVLILQKKIYRDQCEIDEIDRALVAVDRDPYYRVIEMKYFEKRTDEEIAEEMNCDASTVRRNKNRLTREIAVKLYGAQAVS